MRYKGVGQYLPLRLVVYMGLQLQLRVPGDSNSIPDANIDLSFQGTAKSKLCRYVIEAWNAARDIRSEVSQEMYRALREREFQYDPVKLAAIKATNLSDVFIGLSDYKARTITAFLRDLLLGQGERPWGADPTPIPNIPEDFTPLILESIQNAQEQFRAMTGEIMPEDLKAQYKAELEKQLREELLNEARESATRMEDNIEDIFVEGSFYRALYEILDDIGTYPTAVLKGPVLKSVPELQWKQNSNGRWEFETIEKIKPEFRRIDPRLIYPGENSKGPQDRYLCEITRLTRRDLEQLRGQPGVDNSAITAVLDELATSGLNNWLGFTADHDSELSHEWRHPEATFDMLIFWGDLDGDMLIEWGRNGESVPNVEPEKVYSACIYVIGNHVVKARLNYHPLNLRPYHTASFDLRPGKFWGRSICEIVRPISDMANANARALANNMGIASGPQVDINMDRMAHGQSTDQLVPWKRWLTKNEMSGNNVPAIRFYQPDDRSTTLIGVFAFWSQIADEYLGLTKLLTGQAEQGGIGRTASGISMLLNSANKFVKQVVMNIDMGVIEPAVRATYVHLMQYSEDDTIKADINVFARGAVALAIKEALQIRRQEFLNLTNNPVDLQIMGLEGRANLLRTVAATLDMDIDRIIPNNDTTRLSSALQDVPTPEALIQQQVQQPSISAPAPSPEIPGDNVVLPGTGGPITDNFSPSSLL